MKRSSKFERWLKKVWNDIRKIKVKERRLIREDLDNKVKELSKITQQLYNEALKKMWKGKKPKKQDK